MLFLGDDTAAGDEQQQRRQEEQEECEEGEEGWSFPGELSCSYLWFTVMVKHVFPLAVASQDDGTTLSAASVVLWSRRETPEARRRTFYGSSQDDMTVDKFAGYLPVAASSSSCVYTTTRWDPPHHQLLLPAPVPWQLRSWSGTWSDITAARMQLWLVLQSVSGELDWYFAGFKSRMRPPNWWEDMDNVYGISVVTLLGAGYWIQGFRCFPWLGMNYFLKDGLRLDPVAMQCLLNTVNLPYLAKPLYGIMSDSVYICGAHRVPYIIIAGILQVVSWGTIVAIPGARRCTGMLTAFLTVGNLGAALGDVANDALVAETGKRSGKDGQLQSFAWLASAAGGLLGNLLSGLALSGMELESMFSVFVLFLTGHVVLAFMVSEQSFGPKAGAGTAAGAADDSKGFRVVMSKAARLRNMRKRKAGSSMQVLKALKQQQIVRGSKKGSSLGIREQVSLLFGLVKGPRILFPLLWFMGSYAIIPTLSGSLFYYQSQALQINPFFLGLAKMFGQGGLLAGSLLYDRYLKPVPLRTLAGCLQVLLSLCMLSDLGLVFRINLQLGIPDQLYILGASAFVEALGQFKLLPFMVFLAKLCPQGCEGSLLAVFMSCQCLACLVSGYLGAALASSLGVSAVNFVNLPTAIVVQAAAALLPVAALWLLPDGDAADADSVGIKRRAEAAPSCVAA